MPIHPKSPSRMHSRIGTNNYKDGEAEIQCCRGHSISIYSDTFDVEIKGEDQEHAGDIDMTTFKWNMEGLRNHFRIPAKPDERRIYLHCPVCYSIGLGRHNGKYHFKKMHLRRIVRKIGGQSKACINRQCKRYNNRQREDDSDSNDDNMDEESVGGNVDDGDEMRSDDASSDESMMASM